MFIKIKINRERFNFLMKKESTFTRSKINDRKAKIY